MRDYVIDIMINTITEAATNARMSQDELMSAISWVMASILKDKGKEAMDIELGDIMLVAYLTKSQNEDAPSNESDIQVH
ncbi:MAG: hypothetical protein LBU96_00655 [Yokenella regensburgei]|jgi:hypothetical protein|nr:hypothetical protein [Yokenella regensburgei]